MRASGLCWIMALRDRRTEADFAAAWNCGWKCRLLSTGLRFRTDLSAFGGPGVDKSNPEVNTKSMQC